MTDVPQTPTPPEQPEPTLWDFYAAAALSNIAGSAAPSTGSAQQVGRWADLMLAIRPVRS